MPPLCIWAEKDHCLTGRYRQRPGVERVGLFGKRSIFVLQVEESYVTYNATYGGIKDAEARVQWRDATWKDFAVIRMSGEKAA